MFWPSVESRLKHRFKRWQGHRGREIVRRRCTGLNLYLGLIGDLCGHNRQYLPETEPILSPDAGEELHYDPVSWFIASQNLCIRVHLAVKERIPHRIDGFD